MVAVSGTASRSPKNPPRVPKTRSASTTADGCRWTARFITNGVMKWLSICCATTITMATPMAAFTSFVARATMMPGMAPMYGPISGMMLNSPAIMPTTSHSGNRIANSPADTMQPTMNATRSWPRKNPPTIWFSRCARNSTRGFDASGMSSSQRRRTSGRSISR